MNLLFRSVKSDKSELRAAAFIKRICMCVCQAPSPIAAGLLFLVSEIVSSRPSLHPLVSSAPHSVDKNTEKPEKKDEDEKNNDEQEESFWTLNNYDAAKREPEFACATMPSLWELCLLRHHFHPSVAAFTSSMLTAPHTIKFDGVVLYLPSTLSITRGD